MSDTTKPITGTSEDDTLYDTTGDNKINAGDGDDTVYSTEGNDTVRLGDGNDTLITSLASALEESADPLNIPDGDNYYGGDGIDTLVIDLINVDNPFQYKDAFTYAFDQYIASGKQSGFDLGASVKEYFANNNIDLAADFNMHIKQFENIDFTGPPVDITLDNATIAENSSAGTIVGTLGTIDPDAGDTFSYALTNNAGGKFALDGDNLVVNGSLDYETATNHTIEIQSTDAGGLSTTKTFTINVTDVNETPTDITLNNTTINENSSIGTIVGTLGTIDPDAGDTFSYALTNNAGGKFALDGDNLVVNGSLDYETATNHTIEIQSTDAGGLSTTKTFTINVSNINDNPVILVDNDPTANSVAENSSVGTVVGITALGSDADSDATITGYSLTDDAGGKFAIDSNTGVVTVASSLDYETATSHDITVQATSSDGSEASQTFTINVTNISDVAPTVNPATFSIAENTPNGNVVGQVIATDPEADITNYAITAGNGSGAFAIDNNGQITVADSSQLDYESGITQYNLTVDVTDVGGNVGQANITVDLTNINDNPVILVDNDPTANSVAENSSVGTVVGITALGSDADSDATITGYSLTGDAGGKFAIDSNTGVVTVASSLDYETATSHDITVQATSSDGSIATKNFTINVTNINETPTDITLNNTAISENSSVGAIVGTLETIDPDAGDTFSYVLLNDASGKFALDGNNLIVNGDLDYETATNHTIEIQSTDAGSLSTTKIFTINVTSANVETPIDITLDFAEKLLGNGTTNPYIIGDMAAIGAGTYTYSLDPNSTAGFAIDSTTGELTYDGGASLPSTATITVDASGFSKTFNLILGDSSNNYLITGTDADEYIAGFDGTDLLVGDAYRNYSGNTVTGEDDLLDGGTGRGTLVGDVYRNYSGGTVDGGNDTLKGSASADELSGDVRLNLGTLTGGNDLLEGSAGNDTLSGDAYYNAGTLTGGDDTLKGGAGSDVLSGDARLNYGTVIGGKDTFVFTSDDINPTTPETDAITDFRKSDGDVIDLKDILSDYATSGNPITDYLNVTKSGAHTIIKIDADASGGFDHTIVAQNIDLTGGSTDQQTIINSLINDGSLVVE